MSRMNPSRWLLFLLMAPGLRPAGAADLTVDLRSRVEAFKGSGEWRAVSLQQSLPAEKTAVLICDMWDKHWCKGATERVNGLVAKMAPFLESARKRGIQIIHAPSETMAFYQDAPQRKRILALAKIDPPPPLSLPDPPLPIDDKRGGCDTPDQFYKAWTREHPGLRIDVSDVISDNGTEIYSFLRDRDIRTLLVVGVHTNMCVLNRTFAIKRMTALGIHCILVRDLTDAMYNPQDPPHVSHDAGTQLMIEYIEKYWCPTTTRPDLLRAFAH
jgi:nicotinamidase-related amidase